MRESTCFGCLIKFLLILFEKHPFIFKKLFITITLQHSINFNVNNFISILNYKPVHVVATWSREQNHSVITMEGVNWNKESNIKMLKKAPFDCAINEKCCSVDGGRGICPPFASLPRGIWQLKSPHPGEFAVQGKKKVAGRSWNWLMHKW